MLLQAKRVGILTDFPKPSYCSVNSFSKADQELQMTFPEGPGKLYFKKWNLTKKLQKSRLQTTSHVPLENYKYYSKRI